MTVSEIQAHLFSMQDFKYKAFQEKLLPTVTPDTVIGVRTPALRDFAKKLQKDPDTEVFLRELPHKYYEENNLHAFLIERITDFDKCIEELERFLPYIDNWATCDSMRPKCFAKQTDRLLGRIDGWLARSDIYSARYGIEMLMIYFLDEKFEPCYLARVAEIQSEEYYINMMIAWYFATALAKQYDATVCYLEEGRLSVWVHNKTIQKAIESYRITDPQKKYLRSLKRKA